MMICTFYKHPEECGQMEVSEKDVKNAMNGVDSIAVSFIASGLRQMTTKKRVCLKLRKNFTCVKNTAGRKEMKSSLRHFS